MLRKNVSHIRIHQKNQEITCLEDVIISNQAHTNAQYTTLLILEGARYPMLVNNTYTTNPMVCLALIEGPSSVPCVECPSRYTQHSIGLVVYILISMTCYKTLS